MYALQAMILYKAFSKANGLLIAVVSMSSVGNMCLCITLIQSMLKPFNLTICLYLKNSCGVMNVTIESEALLLGILGVLDSNLGPQLSYHDLRFPSIPPGKHTSD